MCPFAFQPAHQVAAGGSQDSRHHLDVMGEAARAALQSGLLPGDEDAAAYIADLFQLGCAAPGDSGAPLDSRPPWIDNEQIRRGQSFAEKHFVGHMLAEISSVCIFMAVGDGLQALIFSGHSDTPAKAFRRYLSTVSRGRKWYRGDLWDKKSEAHRQLQTVRQMHAHYRRQMNSVSPEERMRKTTLQPPLLQSRVVVEAMREDIRDTAPVAGATYANEFERREWLNQMEMSATQLAIVGLLVTYPDRFGAAGATEEELEGFVHLWRVLGHLLGVEDRFNFCNGGLEAVRRRTLIALHQIVVPALAQADASWEHMSRCVVEGVGFIVPHITYEVLLIYALETVGVATPRLRASLSVEEILVLRIMTLLSRWVLRVSPLRILITSFLNRRIALAQKVSPDRLRAKEASVYSRQRAAGAPAPSSAFKILPFVFPLMALAAFGGCSFHILLWCLTAGAASVLVVAACLAHCRL